MTHIFHNPVRNDTAHANALRRAMCALTDALGQGDPENITFYLEQARGYCKDARVAASHDVVSEQVAAEYMSNFVADMTVLLRRQWAPAIIS